MNGHTLGFHPQTQQVGPRPFQYLRIIRCIMGCRQLSAAISAIEKRKTCGNRNNRARNSTVARKNRESTFLTQCRYCVALLKMILEQRELSVLISDAIMAFLGSVTARAILRTFGC